MAQILNRQQRRRIADRLSRRRARQRLTDNDFVGNFEVGEIGAQKSQQIFFDYLAPGRATTAAPIT